MNKNDKKSLLDVIKVDKEKCINCHACIRACPVKYCNDASGDYIKINSDLCIGCGRCIRECQHGARQYIDDFDNFLNAVAAKEPMVAIVSPSTAAIFTDNYLHLNGWLKSIGVNAVFDVSFGGELTAKSYYEYIKEEKPDMVITQPCPTLVTYMEVYKPELLEYLAPVDSPMLHTIKYIKENHPKYKNHKIVVISPCLAKKREFADTELNAYNILHDSIQSYMKKKGISLKEFPQTDFDNPPAEIAVAFSSPGGLLDTLKKYSPKIAKNARIIEGIETYDYLNHIKDIKEKNPASLPFIIDCLNCSMGCNGGPLTFKVDKSPDELEYWVKKRKEKVKKHYKQANLKEKSIEKIVDKAWQKDLFNRNYIDRSEFLYPDEFSEEKMWEIFNLMNKFSEEDLYNCGACGYNTCQCMALAIYRGLNKPENCHYYLLNEHKKDIEIIKTERNKLEKLKKELEDRVKRRTESLEEQKQKLIKSRKIVLSLMEDSEHARKHLINTNKQLEEQTKKAKTASIAKSEFLANMSHEIRTPLNGIIGFIQILADTNLDKDQKDLINEVQKSYDILFGIINNILDFSKIEAGKMSLENISFDLPSVIEDISMLYYPVANKKNLNLRIVINSNVPEKVYGDPSKLKQIIANLVSNSIKFTPKGEILISANNIESENEDTAKIIVKVIDTGIGIPKNKLGQIFELFSQADTSTTREYGGTGLGLSIAKKITELMGGKIEIYSKVDKGTEIAFTIPFKIDKRSGVPIKPKRKKNIPKLLNRKTKARKILIVEDTEMNYKVVKKMLNNAGYECDIAVNGEEGLNAFKNGIYDLILMDCQMPIMDGYQVTEEIRKIENGEKRIPIIALTAHTQNIDIIKCKEAGMDSYISKPIEKNLFLETIERFMPLDLLIVDKLIAEGINTEEVFTKIQEQTGLEIKDVQEIFLEFLNEFSVVTQNIQNSLQNKDFESLKGLAHKLKGMSSTMQLNLLFQLVRELELNAKSNNFSKCTELTEKINLYASMIKQIN